MNYNSIFDLNIKKKEKYTLKKSLKKHSSGSIFKWRLPKINEGFSYYLKTFYILENGYNYKIPQAKISDIMNCGPHYQWGTFTNGLSTPLYKHYEPSNETIAVCIICQNSEKTIKQCLDSVSGWVDEIIVLDSGSTDNTIDIVSKYTDKIFNSSWPNNYSIQRNLLIEKISSEWMLMIDSDEYVGNFFGSEIRQLIKFAYVHNQDLIWLPRQWLIKMNKHNSKFRIIKGHWLFWPDPQARIARMSKKPYYEGAIHENLRLRFDSRSLIIYYPKLALKHLKLIYSDYSSRKNTVYKRNFVKPGGAHTFQLLPENHLNKLKFEEFNL